MSLRHATARILALALSFVAAPRAASARIPAGHPDAIVLEAQGAAQESPAFLERSDIAFALFGTAAVVVAGHNDLWLRGRAIQADSRLDRDIANGVRALGDPALVLPVLLAGYGLARATHAPEIASGLTEIGLSVTVAGAGALLIKEVVGRARPEDSPDDSHSFRVFSGDTSFPSGHATVAFALAESINRTSGSAWAPFLTYPLAALVGWSRVRDDRHWTSDVVAGAALGVWTARKVHREWPAERRLLSRFGLAVCAPGGAPGLAITLR
jgi:membrane-associated phospholipid phosphatase